MTVGDWEKKKKSTGSDLRMTGDKMSGDWNKGNCKWEMTVQRRLKAAGDDWKKLTENYMETPQGNMVTGNWRATNCNWETTRK